MAFITIIVKDDPEIRKLLLLILKKLNLMPTKAEFDAVRDELTGALTNIADDITRLTDAIQGGGLTAAEEEQAWADLRALADRANEIAGRTEEPPPTEEEEEEPPV